VTNSQEAFDTVTGPGTVVVVVVTGIGAVDVVEVDVVEEVADDGVEEVVEEETVAGVCAVGGTDAWAPVVPPSPPPLAIMNTIATAAAATTAVLTTHTHVLLATGGAAAVYGAGDWPGGDGWALPAAAPQMRQNCSPDSSGCPLAQ